MNAPSDTTPHAFSYAIDYNNRTLMTCCDNAYLITPFNAAFAKAIECCHHLEDRKKPDYMETLYLAVYARYMNKAPRYQIDAA